MAGGICSGPTEPFNSASSVTSVSNTAGASVGTNAPTARALTHTSSGFRDKRFFGHLQMADENLCEAMKQLKVLAKEILRRSPA